MAKNNFRSELRRADARLETNGIPADVDRRLREKLQATLDPQPKRSFALSPLGLGLAGAALAALVLVLVLRPAPDLRVGGFVVVASASSGAVSASADGSISVPVDGLTISDEAGGTFEPSRDSVLRREASSVRVVRGRVEIAVAKRAPSDAPYRVLVSAGVISVLGTRFTVTQSAGGGSVALHEGSIRFEHADGTQELLHPGESTTWPRVTAPPPAPAPEPVPSPSMPPVPSPVPTRPPLEKPTALVPPAPVPEPVPPAPTPVIPPAPTLEPPVVPAPEIARADALLERIATLRSRRRFDEAAASLETALGDGYSATTRERLSFELGSILTFQGQDRTRACTHWARHLASFGKGRYGREIDQARSQAGCSDTP